MKTGTNPINLPTTVEDLVQSWAVLQHSLQEYSAQTIFAEAGKFELAAYNTAYMMFNYTDFGKYHDVVPREPTIEQITTIDTESDDKYRKFTPERWAAIFGLQLHDAYITYTYMAARETDVELALQYANYAVDFANSRRQLQPAITSI